MSCAGHASIMQSWNILLYCASGLSVREHEADLLFSNDVRAKIARRADVDNSGPLCEPSLVCR